MTSQMSIQILLASIALIVSILGAVIPFSWRFLQSRRLHQEELIHRESHNLELFKALSSTNLQLQLAAAAVLAERLTSNAMRNAEAEHRIIIRALLAVTKDLRTSPSDPFVPKGISKFIADSIVKNNRIPLKQFDWQNTRLTGAWWQDVDASGADFWGADLSQAGMRRAILRNAVLVEVRLDNSVLVGADLTNARLMRASLLGTDLTGTTLEGANLTGATYNDQTRFPDGFDPIAKGLVKDRGLGHNVPRTAAPVEATV